MLKKGDATSEDKIMQAAKEVFMKYGLYGARMQDIADVAGINKALLHYYYRNKEKLFDKVFEGALQKYFHQTDVFSDDTLPIKQRLTTYVNNLIDFLEEYPQMTIFIIKEISVNPTLFKEKVMAIKKPTNIPLIKALENAIQSGEIESIDAAMFMVNVQSMCAYPFIATPLFRHIFSANNKDWNTFSAENLKISVKKFIEMSIRVKQTPTHA